MGEREGVREGEGWGPKDLGVWETGERMEQHSLSFVERDCWGGSLRQL